MNKNLDSFQKGIVRVLCVLFFFTGAPTLAMAQQDQKIDALFEAFEQEGNDKEQISAAKKIAQTGGDKALRVLSSAVFQKDDPIASACLSALAKHHAGTALETAIQCIKAPENQCSPRLKSQAKKTATSIWKKSLRGKGKFKEPPLRFRVEIKLDKNIPKKDRWEPHINAALLEALSADPMVSIGDEVDLFSDDSAAKSWKPQKGIVLLVRGKISSISRKGSSTGQFSYIAKSGPFEVELPDLKGKAKRFSPIKGKGVSEDAESLDSRIIKLSLTKLAQELASKIHIWSRGKAFPFEEIF